jgi:hypothetical protein
LANISSTTPLRWQRRADRTRPIQLRNMTGGFNYEVHLRGES